jgi:hypothetical protein
MKRLVVTLITSMAVTSAGIAQNAGTRVAAIRTVPEKTDFKETSGYADVVAFLEAIDQASDRVHLTTFGMVSLIGICWMKR